MAILEIKNIKKDFGKTQVLKDISFSLEKGQVLAIIGSSGSGKTTLLRCLNFLETPDEGQILVDGKELLTGSEKQIRENRLHFGLVFQNFNLFPQYTALKNVTLAPSLLKLGTPEELEDIGKELLDKESTAVFSGTRTLTAGGAGGSSVSKGRAVSRAGSSSSPGTCVSVTGAFVVTAGVV